MKNPQKPFPRTHSTNYLRLLRGKRQMDHHAYSILSLHGNVRSPVVVPDVEAAAQAPQAVGPTDGVVVDQVATKDPSKRDVIKVPSYLTLKHQSQATRG